jgi:hypothetical protein
MPKRPEILNQQALEEALRRVGCPESCIAPTVSNYRLFVPLVLAALGRERVYDIVCEARPDLGLGQQSAAWRASIKHIVAWAEAEIDSYKQRRDVESVAGPAEDCAGQLKLL